MKVIKSVLMVFAISLFALSCGEDNEDKIVNLKLQMQVGEDILMHGSTYKINGVDVQFSNVAFYLGDMTCELSDGTIFTLPSRYHLIKPGVYDFNFSIPGESAKEDVKLSNVSFFVGVDATTNAETEMDFTERAEDDPLGEQNPSMHWGWAGGYRFLSIDGIADIDADGEFETQLVYHLGRDEFLKNIRIVPNEVLVAGDNNFRLAFDMSAFLANLNFAEENFTKVTPNDLDLAEKLFNNYSSSFTIVK